MSFPAKMTQSPTSWQLFSCASPELYRGTVTTTPLPPPALLEDPAQDRWEKTNILITTAEHEYYFLIKMLHCLQISSARCIRCHLMAACLFIPRCLRSYLRAALRVAQLAVRDVTGEQEEQSANAALPRRTFPFPAINNFAVRCQLSFNFKTSLRDNVFIRKGNSAQSKPLSFKHFFGVQENRLQTQPKFLRPA